MGNDGEAGGVLVHTSHTQTPEHPIGAAERKVLCELLAKHRGRKKPLCEALSISYSTLWRRLKKYDLI